MKQAKFSLGGLCGISLLMMAAFLLIVNIMGCAVKNENQPQVAAKNEFNPARTITVITRETGSGTRDAFIEIAGILVKRDGKKKDNTTAEALTIDGTQGVMSSVAGDLYAIGYISLGSLNGSVKSMPINGVLPTKLSVKDGTYPIARPFNIAVKEQVSEAAQDFIDFILSDEGQQVVEKNGYVAVNNSKQYKSKNLKGKIIVAGSSSVSPVMEKLKEAYMALNSSVEIEIQTNDSSSGMQAAKNCTCDIGMASRDLKESEASALKSITIARDGIAVIVNQKNPINDMRLSELREIYIGSLQAWN